MRYLPSVIDELSRDVNIRCEIMSEHVNFLFSFNIYHPFTSGDMVN